MNAVRNCKNPRCLAKNSVWKVFTIKYYTKSYKTTNFQGEEIEKKIDSHTDKAVFYVCSKCAWMTEFNNDIIPPHATYWVHLVPTEDKDILLACKKKEFNSCIYCDSKSYPPHPEGKTIVKDAITRLFILPDREFFGYHCHVCNRTYGIQPKIMKWNNIYANNKETELINVLDTLHSFLKEDQLESHTFWDMEERRLIWNVLLTKIGGFAPVRGAPMGLENYEIHTITFPKKTAKRYLKFLEKRGCKIA